MKMKLVLTIPITEDSGKTVFRKITDWEFEVSGGKARFIPSRREIKKAAKDFMAKVGAE